MKRKTTSRILTPCLAMGFGSALFLPLQAQWLPFTAPVQRAYLSNAAGWFRGIAGRVQRSAVPRLVRVGDENPDHATVATSDPALPQHGSISITILGQTSHQWCGVRGQTGPRQWPAGSRCGLVFRGPASGRQNRLHLSWWNSTDRRILRLPAGGTKCVGLFDSGGLHNR